MKTNCKSLAVIGLLFVVSSAEAGDLINEQVLRRNNSVGYARKQTRYARRQNPLPQGVKVTENEFENRYLDLLAAQRKYEQKLEKWEYNKEKLEAKAEARLIAEREKEERKALADYKRELKRQEKLASKSNSANQKWTFGRKDSQDQTVTNPADSNSGVNWAPGQDPNDPNAAAQRAQLASQSTTSTAKKPPSIWERLKVALFGKQTS